MTPLAEQGRRDDFFSPQSAFWRVNREMVGLLAGGRALLLQIAHPKIAAGVAEHSHFQTDPLSRLRRTMNTMWSIVFDEPARARDSLGRITRVHSKVQGFVAPGEGFTSGARYTASDPELLLWVHATLIDSGMAAYENFAAPLSPRESRDYYLESKTLARLFEIPERLLPETLADFHAYMNAQIAGGELAVGRVAQALADDILYPSPWFMKPAAPLFRLITAGLLPWKLREAYGLDWNPRREKTFKRSVQVFRMLRPLVPSALRIVPQARAAERRIKKRGILEQRNIA
jgi:uncharacterized protein (DUF2236 family)